MHLYQMKYTGVLIKCTKIVLELSNEYKTFLIVRNKKNILLHLEENVEENYLVLFFLFK